MEQAEPSISFPYSCCSDRARRLPLVTKEQAGLPTPLSSAHCFAPLCLLHLLAQCSRRSARSRPLHLATGKAGLSWLLLFTHLSVSSRTSPRSVGGRAESLTLLPFSPRSIHPYLSFQAPLGRAKLPAPLSSCHHLVQPCISPLITLGYVGPSAPLSSSNCSA